MTVGERIKIKRMQANMTLEELSPKVNVSRQTLSRYETGIISHIPSDRIELIADALGTTPGYLMGWEENPIPYSPEDERNKKLGACLESLRSRAGLKQAQIAQKLSITTAAYNDYERGKRKMPLEFIIRLAKDYNVSATNLSEGKLSLPQPQLKDIGEPYNPTKRIPLLGYISAGLPLYAEQHIDGYIYTELRDDGEYFALRVQGDSMDLARIFDGSIVIVRRQPTVENGSIAIVLVNGDNATIKRFRKDENQVTLLPQSSNPNNLPQIYNTQRVSITVLGKVVECKTLFE